MIMQKLRNKFHVLPMMIALMQIPFYIIFAFRLDIYQVWMPLIDQVLKDSVFLLILVAVCVNRWYFENIVIFIGLCLSCMLNIYVILFGSFMVTYIQTFTVLSFAIYLVMFFRYVWRVRHTTKP